MAEADLKHIHGFFVSKVTMPDSDAGRSPTSPLDFGVFGGLFSPRSLPSSPLSFNHRNKWTCDKVGLSILSSNIGDQRERENIVLASQIKVNVNTSAADISSSLSDAVNIRLNPIIDNSPRRSSSSPMDITSSHSLSAREMSLSEDYTCIISHGPIPKTTHIFGDCILDCDPKELEEIEKPEDNSFSDDSFSWISKPQHNDASTEKNGVKDSLEIWTGSSYKEDAFPMVMHLINPSEALQ